MENNKSIKNYNNYMGLKKLIMILFIMAIFTCNFTSSTSIEPVLRGENVTMYQTCNNCTYCNITNVKNNVGTVLLSNIPFDANGTYYSKILNGGNTTTAGTYTYCYYCGNAQESQTGCINFEVTNTGNELTLYDSLVRIFLIVFFIILLICTYLVVRKIDFKRWNESILKKYENKNFVKVVLSSLLYNIMKNTYVIYYLIGLPIFMIITDLTYIYNITDLITFMEALLLIYTVGTLIVGLIFLSYVQEWLMNMIELVRNLDWGIS